ncbi:endolytic transglycosylase MltG [bacterium]|nr:endolytic transglycosylase MltG [bacterium]
MKLKYYLRGLGIGIIVTTILLMIAFALHKPTMSDVDIIARAKQLGMVMPEDEETLQDTETTESTEVTAVPETETAQIEEQTTEVATNIEEPVTAEETEMTDTEVATEVSSEANEENNTAVNAAPYTLVVNRGDVCRIVCENLQANGVVDDAEAFRKFLGQKGFASSISVGSYSIPYGLDYEEIYQILKLGPQ